MYLLHIIRYCSEIQSVNIEDIMKTLYELAKINQKNSKIVESMIPLEKSSPLKRLNTIVLTKTGMDESSVMLEIYGKKNIAAFSRLKSRLKDILIRSTLLQNISVEAAGSRMNEAHNQLRHVLASRLLLDLKHRNLSVEIAEKSILKAIKYHATESIIFFARLLVSHFGTGEYNKYKLNKYLAIQEKYLRVYEWEIKAENYFLDLQQSQLQSLAAPTEVTKDKAKKYVDELDAVVDVRSYFFILNRYKVKAAYYEYNKDYGSLLELSESILSEFTSDFKSATLIQSIILRKVWALIQAGRNDETINLGISNLSKLSPGTLGWFVLAHYTLKAQLYKAEYKDAISLISQIVEHPKLQKIGETYKELFYTTLGYIHLIVDSGLAGDQKEIVQNMPDFKIGKHLNMTPVFSKDKRGINVSILLLQIAFLLHRKEYSIIIDKLDSLNQYAYRYLRKDDSFRSNCMIKMVIQMTKADFNPIRTERYTHDMMDQLKEVKIAGSGENIETEIIPYEILWDIMIKSL